MKQFPTKSKAKEAAVPIRDRILGLQKTELQAVALDRVADRYEAERMPVRHATSRGYKGKLKIVRAKWGRSLLPLNPDEVEFWLKEVRNQKGVLYSQKSREHLKSMLCILHDAAMFFRYLPIRRNPMELVKVPVVKAAPRSKPRIILTKDEFRLLLARFAGMYRVMILLAGCVGLRRSEIFGLKWSDFDWLKNEIFIQRSHVEGYEDETKTESSNTLVPLHPTIVEAVLAWRQQSAFSADTDYVFASPVLMGKKPLNPNSVQRDYLRPESIKAGLKPLGWHALRHSYRTRLAEKKTGPEVQRDLMRHSTITMSLDGYGQGVPDLNREANYAVVSDLLQ
ncbi:MAG: site-specific integrase [Terriglobales bacterium]|jgi:integrase